MGTASNMSENLEAYNGAATTCKSKEGRTQDYDVASLYPRTVNIEAFLETIGNRPI